MRLLVRNREKLTSVGAIRILNLPDPLAIIRIEEVAEDRAEPRVEVGASFEAVHLRPRSHERVLNQIIRRIPVAAPGHGKRTKGRKGGAKLVNGDGRSR